MNITNNAIDVVNPIISQNTVLLTPIPDAIAALDFERLKYKFTASSDALMTLEEWDAAIPEYRRFLALKFFYPGLSLIPSKQVNKIWHAHILDTRSYREACEMVFGRFIDHYPYFGIYGKEDYQVLQHHFAQTVELYERHFGPYPKQCDEFAINSEDQIPQEVAS